MKFSAALVVSLSALLAIAAWLLPEGEAGRVGKGALAVLFAAALLPSLLSLREADFPTDFPVYYAEKSAPLYREVGENAFAEGVARSVENAFSLPAGSVSVALSDFDFSAMRAGRATVTLPAGAGKTDPLAVAAHVRDCGVEVCEVEFTF